MAGIGEAIGLQNTTRQQGNYTDWLKLAGAERRADKLLAKKEKAALVSVMDFKIPYEKGILPPWGKAIAEVKSGVLNSYYKYAQEDPVTAESRIYQDIEQAKAKVSGLLASNENALEYIKQDNNKFHFDGGLAAMAQSHDSSFEEMESYINQKGLSPFILTDKNGSFAYTKVPKADFGEIVKFESNDYTKLFKPGKGGVPGKVHRLEFEEVTDETIRAKAGKVGQRTDVITDYLYQNPEDHGLLSGSLEDQQTLGKKIGQWTEEKIRTMRPVGRQVGEDWVDLPSPPSATEAEKRTPTVVMASGSIFEDSPLDVTGADGKTTTIQRKTQGLSYDAVVNIADSKPVTIMVTDEIVDMNPELKGVKFINVKPNNLYRTRKRDGSRALTAVGQVLQATDESGQPVDIWGSAKDTGKITKSFNPMIPYELVQGELEKTYPGKMTSIYEQLEIGKKPAKKQAGPVKMITVTVNGQSGTIPEDQWEAFKKKYPSATR